MLDLVNWHNVSGLLRSIFWFRLNTPLPIPCLLKKGPEFELIEGLSTQRPLHSTVYLVWGSRGKTTQTTQMVSYFQFETQPIATLFSILRGSRLMWFVSMKQSYPILFISFRFGGVVSQVALYQAYLSRNDKIPTSNKTEDNINQHPVWLPLAKEFRRYLCPMVERIYRYRMYVYRRKEMNSWNQRASNPGNQLQHLRLFKWTKGKSWVNPNITSWNQRNKTQHTRDRPQRPTHIYSNYYCCEINNPTQAKAVQLKLGSFSTKIGKYG